MPTRYFLLACVCVLGLGSCQSSRTAFQNAPEPPARMAVVLIHDSQGPEPTVVPVSELEASMPAANQEK